MEFFSLIWLPDVRSGHSRHALNLTDFNSYGNMSVPLIAGWKSKPNFGLRLAVARLKKGQVPKNYVRSYRDGR